MKYLATDLDRTLIPNGKEKKQKEVYDNLEKILKKNNINLIYVTGRRISQVKQAMIKYKLPKPKYVIAMVGTKIYCYKNNNFKEILEWEKELSKGWKNVTSKDILVVLKDIPEIWPQSKATSNKFKQSYLASPETDKKIIKSKVEKKLSTLKIKYSYTYSVDAARNIAQIDIMSPNANKVLALNFLLKKIKYKDIITSGDTGNDLSMLTSGFKSILVKNAKLDVKKELMKLARKKNIVKKVYICKGNKNLNGNYASGILEGLEHFNWI